MCMISEIYSSPKYARRFSTTNHMSSPPSKKKS